VGASLTLRRVGYQPRTNIVKDEKGDLVTDCHSVLAKWRNRFSQLLDIHGVNHVVRQTEIHTAEPSASDVEMAVEKLKRHKSPGTGQILTELIKARGKTTCCEIHKFINSVSND